MPKTLGDETKTLVLKKDQDMLHEEFLVTPSIATITLSTDLITGNVTNIAVDGISMAPITYGTSHAATMAAIVVALKAIATVADASYVGDVITIEPVNQDTAAIIVATVTSGVSQPTVTVATDVNTVYAGSPVKLETDGTISPAASGENNAVMIGYALQTAKGNKLTTVAMKASTIILGLASTSALNAGPVKYAGVDASTLKPKVDDASVTITDLYGWSLDPATDALDEVRIAIL